MIIPMDIATLAMGIKNIVLQIGPAYDPLFYDVMIYIFGTMMFGIFLLSVIAYWLRHKGIGGTARETWVQELERYYEREGIGLLPEERRR